MYFFPRLPSALSVSNSRRKLSPVSPPSPALCLVPLVSPVYLNEFMEKSLSKWMQSPVCQQLLGFLFSYSCSHWVCTKISSSSCCSYYNNAHSCLSFDIRVVGCSITAFDVSKKHYNFVHYPAFLVVRVGVMFLPAFYILDRNWKSVYFHEKYFTICL